MTRNSRILVMSSPWMKRSRVAREIERLSPRARCRLNRSMIDWLVRSGQWHRRRGDLADMAKADLACVADNGDPPAKGQ